MSTKLTINRRGFLRQAAMVGGVMSLASVANATGLCRISPVQPEGPFYPIEDQIDTDSDLTHVSGAQNVAQGKVIYVQGQVTNELCEPVDNVLVEIWQACASGRYNHANDPNTAPLDPNFQYWGKAVTNRDGTYKFKTIIPGAYPAGTGWIRPPHIHFKVTKLGYTELITQMYFSGNSLNSKDRILQKLSKQDQQSVIVELKPGSDGIQVANFNITIERV